MRWRSALIAVAVGALLAPGVAAAAAGPTLAGSISDSNALSGALSVAVSGHYAYTTAYWPGELTAVDISNPSAPVIAGSSASTTNLTDGVTVNVAGGYAFAVSKNRNASSTSNDDGTGNSLTIFDITSNPAQPAILGSIRDANLLFGAYGIAVSGHYAYVAAQGCLGGQPCPNPSVGSSFVVIDIASPGSPTIVASLQNSALPPPWSGIPVFGHATAVAISGNYAYVTAAYQNRLTVIDISNPTAPRIVASLQDATNLQFPVDVAVSGNYAYVTDQITTGRLTVVDVSNPANPQVVASLLATALNGAYRIRLRGGFAYVSSSAISTVTAVDISNPLNPRVAGAYSASARLNKTTGLDVDSTGQYVIASSPYQSGQSAPNYPPFPLQPGGPTDTGTIAVIRLDPAPIGVTIASSSEPANPTAQTNASFTFSTADAISFVQCQLDGAPLGLCTSATTEQYSSLGAGSHTFLVQATDAAGKTASASYTWTVTAPSNSSPPAISGTAAAGQTLTASAGTWTGSPVFSYQWLDCDQNGQNCNAISGATASTYVLQNSDAGSTVEVRVTGTTSAGSTPAASSPTAIVTGPPVNSALPSVSGTATQGQTLSGSNGSWTGYPAPTFSYQWLDCDQGGQNCTAISGATGSTYALQASDVSSTIELTVTASNGSGSTPSTSAPTAVVNSVPANSSPPTVSGTAAAGQTLTASPGSWSGSPAPSFSYQWLDCDQSGQNCSAISGAAASTYVLQNSDVGSTVAVQVTGTNSAGSAQASSGATAIVTGPPVSSALPSVSGTATQGQTLTGSNGSWTGYPAPTFSYQWLDCDQSGQHCTSISGATGSTYVLQASDGGSTVELTVTASNASGSTPATSAPTAVVTSVPANTSQPTVTGTAMEGQALSASAGSWSGYPSPTLSFQWQRCDSSGLNCSPISGATSAGYTLLSADVGSTIEAVVTASNNAGSANATSAPTAVVTTAAGPVTSLLDNFARADNTGPPGPNWTHMTLVAATNLYISGGQVTGYTGNNGDYWNTQAFGPNSEVWIKVTVKPNIDKDSVALGLRFQNPGATNASGYQAYYIFRSTPPDQYKIVSRTNGPDTTLVSTTGPTLAAGDQLLFRAIGSTLELWRFSSGTWTRILVTTDSAYRNAGYLTLMARDSTVRLANFGGGTLP